MSARNPRTLAEIKADPRVVELWTEDDGWNDNGRPAYWVTLAPGLEWDDCHGLHEGTVRELAEALGTVSHGYCADCLAYWARRRGVRMGEQVKP